MVVINSLDKLRENGSKLFRLSKKCNLGAWTNRAERIIWIKQGTHMIQFNQLDEVHRCLARYSPRATTNSQPINRAPMSQQWSEMQISGQIWSFLGKKSYFYWRKQKFWYPHNGKTTQATCLNCFLVGHGTKWAKKVNIWQNANFGHFWAKNNFFSGGK